MDWNDIRTNAAADLRRGLGVSWEDLVIAALVMMPLALGATLVVSAMAWWPSALMIALWLALTIPATLWNAGWRARTSAADAAG
jgi:hypothetical protein